MKGKIFLVQWDKIATQERARVLRAAGWEVAIESEDGARAHKNIRENPPHVVVYLSRLSSHGRVTPEALRGAKSTRDLPIIFVDGKPEDVEKTKAKIKNATFSTGDELESSLAKLMK